jgi:preprotein translocase subunit YajC
MRSRIALFTLALVLGLAVFASAQTAVQGGTIVRIDPQASIVILDDGRIYRVTPSTAFTMDNRPVTFSTLRPGDRIVIQAGEPVVYRDGRYVALAPGTTVVTQSPPPVVVQAPPPQPAPVIVGAPVGVRQTIYGKITDVDRDGKVKIKTDRDSFEARITPEALRQVRKGDNVVIDLTISPPGAASPR